MNVSTQLELMESSMDAVREEGEAEGKESLGKLIDLMFEDGRSVKDIRKAATDAEFQTQLMAEYGIDPSGD